MRITLYADKSVTVDLAAIAEIVNGLSKNLSVSIGTSAFVPRQPILSLLTNDLDYTDEMRKESEDSDLVICVTSIQYDNNYFFEAHTKYVTLSLNYWEVLTDASMNNGVLYFVAALICRKLFHSSLHDENTGCVNDFWLNKLNIDGAMRSAFICRDCMSIFEEKDGSECESIVKDVESILNEVAKATRSRADVAEEWKSKGDLVRYHVFICHNSDDKPIVRKINEDLKTKQGLTTWIDEDDLRPGLPWQEELEKQISVIGAVAVFVGESGIGPWQNRELRAFIDEFVRRGCPVIPVVLPGCKSIPQLPMFLKQFTWVDLRTNFDSEMKKLRWGITGERA